MIRRGDRSRRVREAVPPARAETRERFRLIGRAHRVRGGWIFDPARRFRGGQRELRFTPPPAPHDGDYCVAELELDGPAYLLEILGADDRPEWDDRAVASQHRLRVRFPDAVEREAAAFREPGPRERQGRLDLRDQLSFTIDPEDAQDHDDALSVRAIRADRFEVGVHIADVSHYVVPGGLIDAEARERGTSTYLPGGSIPMLPASLSSDLCSLRPDRDRLALSVIVELDREGRVHDTRFAESVIRSRHRLHYGEVQDAIDGRRRLANDLQEAVGVLLALARALRRRRRGAGALELEIAEVKAWVDGRGVPVRIERRPHLESHELIEEFMLLANRCVGHEGAARRAGLIYRVHEPPSPAKLDDLDRMLKALGLPRPGQGPDPARALQSLLAVPLDPGTRALVHRLVLRSLARARYLERDLGHFGLACREYCHFTSPIRRYPDLHNHARVREWIRGKRSAAWDPVALGELASQCTATEQNATDAERDAVRVKGLRALEARLGEAASGMITGLVPRGCFVELDAIPVEGFIVLSRELDDTFELDASGVRLVGRRTRRRFSLGDPVAVTIARVDVPAREADFALDLPRRTTRRRKGRG